jgi:hypothetical protein
MRRAAMSCRLCPVNGLFDGSPTAIDCRELTRVSTVPLALVLTAVLTQRDPAHSHLPRAWSFARNWGFVPSSVSPRSTRRDKDPAVVVCTGPGRSPGLMF